MAHSAPDWFPLVKETVFAQAVDLAELAVRTGAIISIDRRGDVVFLEDFENGLNRWLQNISGVGASIATSTIDSRSPNTSVLLTAGSTADHLARISHPMPLVVLAPLGFEIAFLIVQLTETVNYRIEHFNGSNRIDYQIRWEDAGSRLLILDDTGAFVEFATGIDLNTSVFNAGKLVVNLALQRYERFVLNEREFNLSAFSPNSTGLVSDPAVQVIIENIGRAANNDRVSVDDGIITINEPI